MYVAITRARKRLYLSHSQTRMLHGQTRYNIRSRFFDELPDAAMKWITPRHAGLGSFASGGAFTRGDDQFGQRPAFGTTSAFAARRGEPVVGQKAAATGGLRVGMQVFHAKFGEGRVMTLEGTAGDARVQVNFPRHGIKWLAVSVAKLTPVP